MIQHDEGKKMIHSIYHVSTRDMIYEKMMMIQHDTQWYRHDIWWYI